MIDASNATREEQDLFHEVMGIGLAVKAVRGETAFFEHIDSALSRLDIPALQRIKAAYNRLSATEQTTVVSGLAEHEELVDIIEALEQHHSDIIVREHARVSA